MALLIDAFRKLSYLLAGTGARHLLQLHAAFQREPGHGALGAAVLAPRRQVKMACGCRGPLQLARLPARRRHRRLPTTRCEPRVSSATPQ